MQTTALFLLLFISIKGTAGQWNIQLPHFIAAAPGIFALAVLWELGEKGWGTQPGNGPPYWQQTAVCDGMKVNGNSQSKVT